jgi:hypothetical protein
MALIGETDMVCNFADGELARSQKFFRASKRAINQLPPAFLVASEKRAIRPSVRNSREHAAFSPLVTPPQVRSLSGKPRRRFSLNSL